jgi:hypothetical protein
MTAASLALLALAAAPAGAGEADVLAARVVKTGPGLYGFEVTVGHRDTGLKHYADRWEILAPDGTVLGTRVLLHPHVREQPFTRRLEGLAMPAGVSRVTVRAHDKEHGFGGAERSVDLPE